MMGGDLGLAGLASAKQPAFVDKVGACGAMNCAVDSAAAEER
jgi:hypothetical protein